MDQLSEYEKKQWRLKKDRYVKLSKTKILIVKGEYQGKIFRKVRVKHLSDDLYHWAWMMEGSLGYQSSPALTLGISKDMILCKAEARSGDEPAMVFDTRMYLM